MADIKSQISDDVKTAMRSKDKERLGALRLIQAAFKQKEVDEAKILQSFNPGSYSWGFEHQARLCHFHRIFLRIPRLPRQSYI